MRLIDLGTTGIRIVEINPASAELASRLLDEGFTAYLGVISDQPRRRAIVERDPRLANRVAVSRSKRIAHQNNAELLILNGSAVFNLLRHRNFRHVRHLAVTLRPSLTCVVAILLGLAQWLLGRVRAPRLLPALGSSARLIVFSLRRPRNQAGARRYIPHTMGVKGFLAELSKAGARHVVLRWFESLPAMGAGEDLDLLVDDADLATVCQILDSGPGVQPLDLYSVTGLPGTDFRAMPYYPPYLASKIVDNAIDHHALCRVPSRRHHFLSLAYHALYHKGLSSGLPQRVGSWTGPSTADHDYPAILRGLAEQLGIDIPITLADLDRYLDSQGWRPPHDMLIRLARHNRWIRSLLQHPADRQADHKIALFLLREVALERGGIQRACELLGEHGFQVLATRRFEPKDAATIARSIRGGNWGQGPWPLSGGPPVAAIVTHDPAPIAPTRKQQRRYPFLANARLLCKAQIRDAFNYGHSPETRCNVVHSSDNGREALDYLRIIVSDENDSLYELLQRLERGCLHSARGTSAVAGEAISRRSARSAPVLSLRDPAQFLRNSP